jgi:hypothetical protein
MWLRNEISRPKGQARKKQFFFEKKNQKTFILFGMH